MTASENKRYLFLIVALTLLAGPGRGAAAMAFLRPATPKSQESDGAGSVRALPRLETKKQILNALHHQIRGLGALAVHDTEFLMQR
jgi:hypothetical protein